MSLLDKIFRRQPAATEPTVADSTTACIHAVLAPRWDDSAELGKEDKVSGYVCESCQSSFTKEEGLSLRSSLAERLPRDA